MPARRKPSAQRAALRWFVALALLSFVAACASGPMVPAATLDDSPPRLAPEPFRSLGLALHTAGLATGLYGLGERLPADFRLSKAETLEGLSRARGRAAVTWIGHATVLLRLDGKTILTDPVFGEGPPLLSGLPRRLVPPALAVDELPPIDLVVISHGDYDHLHLPSLAALAARFPEAQVVLPIGHARLARAAGFRHVRQLAPFESVQVGRLELTALPAVHASRRLAQFDGDALSWEVRGGGRKVLFVGDTAYGPIFREIGARRGPYDLALVPIGAYEPRELVADMHADPEEAAQIARDVGAPLAIGIHWGTFALSPEPLHEPAERFRATGGAGLDARVLRIGETLVLP